MLPLTRNGESKFSTGYAVPFIGSLVNKQVIIAGAVGCNGPKHSSATTQWDPASFRKLNLDKGTMFSKLPWV